MKAIKIVVFSSLHNFHGMFTVDALNPFCKTEKMCQGIIGEMKVN